MNGLVAKSSPVIFMVFGIILIIFGYQFTHTKLQSNFLVFSGAMLALAGNFILAFTAVPLRKYKRA